ncbi:unnamed protein product [Closterium sp. NIES-65]|nr:unnamed protein product [Closterium sp. NIES-65]
MEVIFFASFESWRAFTMHARTCPSRPIPPSLLTPTCLSKLPCPSALHLVSTATAGALGPGLVQLLVAAARALGPGLVQQTLAVFQSKSHGSSSQLFEAPQKSARALGPGLVQQTLAVFLLKETGPSPVCLSVRSRLSSFFSSMPLFGACPPPSPTPCFDPPPHSPLSGNCFSPPYTPASTHPALAYALLRPPSPQSFVGIRALGESDPDLELHGEKFS